ncbi:MAG: hypothetical protein AAF560_21440 [Acidobacteriota bacterium]
MAIATTPVQATSSLANHAWPIEPDWLLHGDFNADGVPDQVAAETGGTLLYLRSGDGSGDFEAATHRALPGRLTALAAGEINRRDGLIDLALALESEAGFEVWVLESPHGAFDARPERIDVATPADALRLARLDDDAYRDLEIRSGDDVMVVLGRDRRLSWQSSEPVAAPRRSSGAAAARLAAAAPVSPRPTPKAGGAFVVDSAGDGDDAMPGDSLCETATTTCTLRAAIDEANALGGLDTITFSASIVTAIAVGSPLIVTDPLVIDGTSHPAFAGTPVVELDASGLSGPATDTIIRLAAGSDGSTVRGLVIHSSPGNGISIIASGGNVIRGNYLGTDPSGTMALPNVNGIEISGVAPGNVIGGTADGDGNLISGNTADGIAIAIATGLTGTLVQGNFIGTAADGLADLGNGEHGIDSGSPEATIGGTAAGARNVIAFNGMHGINLGDDDTLVQGNFIGVALDGSAAGNLLDGVHFGDPGSVESTVGGAVASARNVISANGRDGIRIRVGVDILVQGNFIGLDPTGSFERGNGGFGVCDGCVGGFRNTIGGSVAGAGNVISANAMGGYATGTFDSVVQGNIIGLDVTGEIALGNGGDGVSGAEVIGGSADGAGNLISANLGVGIRPVTDGTVLGNRIGVTESGGDAGNTGAGILAESTARATLGGTLPGEANVIAFNGGGGVLVTSFGSLNTISGNAIFGNDGLGIDLDDDGITTNDAGDLDTGSNDLHNFPVLSVANAAARIITGTLDSNDGATHTIEVFANASCDASDNGEGVTYLGSTTVTTIDGEAAAFTVTGTAGFSAGDAITATATSPGGSTSEFSACLDATALEIELFSDDFESGDTSAWGS